MAYTPFSSSVVTFQNDPTKLVGTMSVVGGTVGTSVIGLTPVGLNVDGSPVTTANPVPIQPPSSGFLPVSVVGGTIGVSNFPTTQNVSGSVAATGSITALQGTNPWVVTTGNSSVMVYHVGSVATRPITGVSSVQLMAGTNNAGSITAIQGTNPWITTIQANSVAGTYAEDSAHADGQRGLFTIGVRNDAVASFVSANGDYTPFGVDSSGRTIVKPFAGNEASVWATASAVSGGTGSGVASVVVFPAAGAGLKNYITDFMISNTGATTTLVTFIDNDNSVLGKTIAPTGGGSNAIGLNMPIVNVSANNRIGMIISNSSSVVHLWAGGYKAP